MQNDWWNGRRVFLTGHTGFKGAWLSLWLARLGARVCGFSLEAPTVPSLFQEARIADELESVEGDVRDLTSLSQQVDRFAPELVFHLAAQPLVRLSYEDPVATFESNILGTVNLLEAVRKSSSVRTVVVVTSDKCYQPAEKAAERRPYREVDPLGGNDPYSASKGCAEIVTNSYRCSFLSNIGVASARAGNVIGGGDWAVDRLVPDMIRSYSSGAPLELRYPRATRPWQHVLEPLSGYLQLAQRLSSAPQELSQSWNFGPSQSAAQPVAELADMFQKAWGDKAAGWRDISSADHYPEASYLELDSSKAGEVLGWHGRLDFAQTVEWTAHWYREHSRGSDARQLTMADIERYEALRPLQ